MVAPGAQARQIGVRAQSDSPDYPWLIVAGVAAAATGRLGGAEAGERIERANHTCSCDDPGLFGAIVGAAAGPALLTPLAVHVAAGGRGSLRTSYGRAAAIGAAGLVSLFAFGAPGIAVLAVVAPAAQVYSAIRVVADGS